MSDDYRVSTDVITCFIQKGIESFLFRQHQQSLDVARFVPLASNDIFVYTEVPLIDFMHAVTFELAGNWRDSAQTSVEQPSSSVLEGGTLIRDGRTTKHMSITRHATQTKK